MYWIGPILAFIGLVAMIYGFVKNNRKILVVAGITLFLAGTLGDFLEGFKEGVTSEMPAATSPGGHEP